MNSRTEQPMMIASSSGVHLEPLLHLRGGRGGEARREGRPALQGQEPVPVATTYKPQTPVASRSRTPMTACLSALGARTSPDITLPPPHTHPPASAPR